MARRRETTVDLDKFNDQRLDAQAKAINKYFCRWIGISAGSNQRWYICRLCSIFIYRESAKHPMTRHAEAAILAHKETHL
jgi:hypothetical protein